LEEVKLLALILASCRVWMVIEYVTGVSEMDSSVKSESYTVPLMV
jgi:hypothetical protein